MSGFTNTANRCTGSGVRSQGDPRLAQAGVPSQGTSRPTSWRVAHQGLGQTYLKPYHFLADDSRNPFKVPFVLCHTRLPLQREEACCFQGRGGEAALAPLSKRFRSHDCSHERRCWSRARHFWSSPPRRAPSPACCKLSKEVTGGGASCSFCGFLWGLFKAGLSLDASLAINTCPFSSKGSPVSKGPLLTAQQQSTEGRS